MRIAGSLYTFIVGILVLIPSIFNNPSQMLSYVILDDLVFPLRDFIETLMFSYLFYYQSNKRKNLAAINEKWQRNAKGSISSSFNNRESLIGKDRVTQSVIEYKEVPTVLD
jgi:hypothetical protein